MFRTKVRRIAAVLLTITSTLAHGGRNDEMTFSEKIRCHGSASLCGAYILAQGAITPRTPEMFTAFLKGDQGRRPAPQCRGRRIHVLHALDFQTPRAGRALILSIPCGDRSKHLYASVARCLSLMFASRY